MKNVRYCFLVIGCVPVFLLMVAAGRETGPQNAPRTDSFLPNSSALKMDTDFGRMPLYFIPNQGQMDKQVAYYVQGKDKTFYFTAEGITFSLTKPSNKREVASSPEPGKQGPRFKRDRFTAQTGTLEQPQKASAERWVVKLGFAGANKSVQPVGEAETGAAMSYFKGKPEDWHTGLPTYSRLLYRDLWPGIDLIYYGTVNKLKYEFIVHPGADPSIIRLVYGGVEKVWVDENGRLQVMTPAGGFSDDVPMAYQEAGGKRVDISVAYRLTGVNGARGAGKNAAADSAGQEFVYGFEVGDYDHSRPVVLDPCILTYCGYIGGSSGDYSYGIVVDGSGNAYVMGETYSTEATFPEAVGPDLTQNGGYDVFVAKVNSSGTALVYCGYIGGSSDENGSGIAVDGSGNAYVTGETLSTEATFPETVGPDLTQNGSWDAFVAKVNSSGTALVYCGYIGGSSDDYSYGIAVDGSGNAYVTGYTYSTEATFPEAVGPDLTYDGSTDVFVAKVNSSGTALVYCGYIGGSSGDSGRGIAVDGSGNAYVTGQTVSTEATFPETVGPDLTFNGDTDAFVAKINSSGTALVYCGYIGGSNTDYGYGIAVDGSGNAYVTGYTDSTEATFPETVGPDLTQNGGYDAFVAKIYYFDERIPKHAVGDFDGDGEDEVAVDFGAAGIWMYDTANWSQLSPVNPESLAVADVDGDNVDEILADLGPTGLWLWNAGAWNQLSGADVESLAVGDVDADGSADVVGEFGSAGLWLDNGGGWTQISGANSDYVTTANLDGTGGDEIIGEFGPIGLWIWNTGFWTQLSGVNADYVTSGKMVGGKYLVGDFGAIGLWMWSVSGGWTQLSGVNADYVITANTSGGTVDGIVGDFGTTGLWFYDGGTWSQLSGANAVYMIRAEVNGDGKDEIAVDFGSMGLWLWGNGAWSQLSGAIAEYLIAGDLDSDNMDEVLADFGALGVWLWDGGAWSQISVNNPD